MELMFVYAGPIIVDKNGNYYSRTITDELLSRYFEFSKKITIATRVKRIDDLDELKKLKIINTKNIEIVEVNYSLRNKKDNKFREKMIESDAVIIRLPSLVGNYGVSLAKKYNKPYLIELVGCPWDSYWNHSVKGKFIAPWMWYSTRMNIKTSKYTLYVTKSFLQKRYPTNGKSVGCSDVILSPSVNETLKKREFKIFNKSKEHTIVLGTTAAIDVKYKGQEYVIEAISKLNREGYNFEYHLAGGGNPQYLKTISEKYQVTDKIKFLGALPHEKVFEYLDNIDIYVQPSTSEGLPRALVEAMSRACPSIGSNAGGIPELLNKEMIFSKASSKEFYKILKSIRYEDMKNQAKKNFIKSKEFDAICLNKKRKEFYNFFCDEVQY